MRKIFSLILTGLMVLVLVSCKKDQVRIKFDINGGSPKIDDQIIKKGEIVIEPKEELLKAGFEFQYWTKDDIKYDFTTPVYENMTLKAYFKEVIDNNGNKEKVLSHRYDFSSISLDQENLELLCKECHNKEHGRFKKQKIQFDIEGNFISDCKE